MRRSVRSLAALLPVLAVLALPVPAAAQMAPLLRVVQTPLYTVALTIGPTTKMLTPADAMTAKSGEVMVNGGPMMAPSTTDTGMGMGAPSSSTGTTMTMSTATDQGMMANHHLEVQITRNDTGAVVQDVTPTIRITDKATGVSHDLSQVALMYDMHMGTTDLHYGQNVWLPDGTYTVQVQLGPDLAEYRDVTVSGGGQMSMAGG